MPLAPQSGGNSRPLSRRQAALATGFVAGLAAAAPSRAEPHGDSLRRILGQRRLRVIVRLDLPPFGYRDSRGQPAGFDVALGALLAEGLGVEPVFAEALNEDRVARLQQGGGDIISHVPVGLPLARQILLTAPCGRVYMSLVSPGWLPFRRPDELDGRGVGVLAGGEAEPVASEVLPAGTRLYRFATLSALTAALEEGRLDALVLPRPALAALQRSLPQLDLSHRFVLAPRWISVGVPFGEHDLLRALNSLIFLARSQGRLAALSYALLGLPQPELPSF